MKRVLVLGATGHLGANTSVYLKEKGYDVVAVGRRNNDNGFFATKGIEYIGGFDLTSLKVFEKLPTDINAVVHLAGTMPAHADTSPMPYVQSIIAGMVNLCEWMKNTKCRRLIFNTTPSDICSYFGTDIPVDENALRSFPKDGGDHAVYAIAKNAAVDILEHYKYASGISGLVFRHLTVYGYHPNPYYNLNGVRKMLPWRYIQHQAMKGLPVEIWGDAQRKKELLYIKDFTEAVRLAIDSSVEGIINLPGDRPYSLEQQIKTIVEVFGQNNKKSIVIYKPEKTNTPQNLLKIGKAKSELGWLPKFSWEKACHDMQIEMEREPFKLLWGSSIDFE